jgi:alcohol dehydrogenase, propanol-preferring
MSRTYKAVEVAAPGVLQVVRRSIPEPGPGQVRIRVEACGICHTDAATIRDWALDRHCQSGSGRSTFA